MSRDKWKIIGKSDDCGRCKIPAAAKHLCRLRLQISADRGSAAGADPGGRGILATQARRLLLFGEVAVVRGISNSGAKRGRCDYDMAAGC